MKRKVRIYKDPFGNGGYMNKTAQWLKKAEDGTQTGITPVTAGIMQQMQAAQPQQMQQQSEQNPQEQILQTVVALAQQGYGQDEITDYLLQNIYGFDKASQEYTQYEPQVLDFVSAVFERSAPEEEEQEVTNEPISDIVADTEVEDTSEEDNSYDQMINDIIYDDEDQVARYGGIPNKRSYVNKLVRKLKKAAEGDQVEEANTANVRGTENNPTGTTGNKNTFIEGVKEQAENHFLKQQAEQMYNNEFSQGMDQQNGMDYGQRGGWRMRRANRKLFGSPNLPSNVTSANYKFGPLGGVRSAEVQFNPLMMASMFPMMSFPGMGGFSSWGYNQPYRKTTKGRLVTEKIASTVNNKSTEDVANATNSEAANKSAEPKTDTATPNTDGTVTVNNEGNTANTTPTQDQAIPIDGAKQAMELMKKKDRWGRFEGSKWYGYDPDTKKWTKGKPDWKLEEEKKTLKKDKWGRPETSQWYGFDPKTKKYTLGKYKGKTIKQTETAIRNELFNSPSSKKLREFYSKPQAAQADDELITELVTLGAGSLATKGLKTAGQEAINFVFRNPNLLRQGPKGLLNAGQKLLNPGQKLLNPGQKLLNPGQKLLEAPAGTQYVLPFAAGGFVNNPMQDQFGNLQKFIYGDQVDDQMLENLYQPPINQSDLNDTDSKDVTDSYFKHGGLYHFDGENDSETNSTNTGKTYNQEELDKILAEKQKSWETDYQTKARQQQQQMMQYNPMMYGYGMPSYNYGYRGSPMGGLASYSPGLLGAAGRLAGSFIGGRQSQFSPVGNPLQYAATAAGITKAGMLPTGMKYSKEKSQGVLGKLGLKHDKVWTLDYATPEQIKAGVKPGTTSVPTAPGMAGSQKGKSDTRLRDAGMNLRERFLNRNTPAETDAYSFTSTLTGSNAEPAKSKTMSNEEMLKSQGRVWDEQQQKWLSKPSGIIGMPKSSGMPESPGMVGKTPQEIKDAYLKGTSIPTVVNKGNTTIINAAGEAIDVNDPMYSDELENLNIEEQEKINQEGMKQNPMGLQFGGYIPTYMAYGGDMLEADKGIEFSSVSYPSNSIVLPGGIGQGNTGPCTEEEVKDPNSPCYDPIYAGQGPRISETPQTAQLKFTEKKQPMSAQQMANITGNALDTGALLADQVDYLNERKNKYIPGMTEFAMGEKQSANERINKGEWNARTGKEGIQGFEGVIRKGGAIKSKKSNASGHKIDMNDFQSLLKLAGLI